MDNISTKVEQRGVQGRLPEGPDLLAFEGNKLNSLNLIWAFRSERRVLLHQGRDELPRLGGNLSEVDRLLIHLPHHTSTFRIFSITCVRCPPSKGTLPVSNS